MNLKNSDIWSFVVISIALFICFVVSAHNAGVLSDQLEAAQKEIAALKHSRAPISITITVKGANDVAPVMRAVLPALSDTEMLK